MLKAIETVYNGYRFRSRLEARWAVFFDALGIRYEYEKEGYDLDGTWYLPDFWLPEHQYLVEIKPAGADINEWPGHPYFDYQGKLEEQGRSNPLAVCQFFLLKGEPWLDQSDIRMYSEADGTTRYAPWDDDAFGYCGYVLGDNNYRWCECPWCHKIGLAFDGRAGRLCNCSERIWKGGYDKIYNTASPRLLEAYTAARQAHFEHGESGAPTPHRRHVIVIPEIKHRGALRTDTCQQCQRAIYRTEYDIPLDPFTYRQHVCATSAGA